MAMSKIEHVESVAQKDSKLLLKTLWENGVERVRGKVCVSNFFQHQEKIDAEYTAIAIGKAATDMMLGAIDSLGNHLTSGLVLTKHHHLSDELKQHNMVICHESSHPVPDESSLEVGKILIEFIQKIPQSHKVLVLISGGASSLVEVLIENCSLNALQAANEWALQSGLNINEINYMRQRLSCIKGGKLCNYFAHDDVTCLYISDVPNDNMNVIGSGLLYSNQDLSTLIAPKTKNVIDHFLKQLLPDTDLSARSVRSLNHFTHKVIANNAIAREAAMEKAIAMGYKATIIETPIDMDYQDAANMIFTTLHNAYPGIYIWGGEPTVELPNNPGLGGRNQALALLLSQQLDQNLKGKNTISILVAGTDGTDGPTGAAGAIIDQDTWATAKERKIDIHAAVKEANAYPCLKALECLFSPGPTGTNVMDLVVAIVD